jgi:hypothetical protein
MKPLKHPPPKKVQRKPEPVDPSEDPLDLDIILFGIDPGFASGINLDEVESEDFQPPVGVLQRGEAQHLPPVNTPSRRD